MGLSNAVEGTFEQVILTQKRVCQDEGRDLGNVKAIVEKGDVAFLCETCPKVAFSRSGQSADQDDVRRGCVR